jgi:hypothetical protein
MSEADDMVYYDCEKPITYMNDRTWTTKNKKEMKWEDMETSHLKNVLKMLEKNNEIIPIMLLVELRLRKGK